MKILIINPGSTSTKIAVWEKETGLTFEKNIEHPPMDLANIDSIIGQKDYRKDSIIHTLKESGHNIVDFSAIAARGGMLKPLAGGTYLIDEDLLKDSRNETYGRHASNLGSLIAAEFAKEADVPAYITDPVSVDEFNPLARYSGIPDIKRRSQLHALNIKAIARKVAAEMGKKLTDLNLIVAHLGGGISIAALENGLIIDVNNANEMGPYSPERTGTLPVGDLVEIAFSGRYNKKELKDKIIRSGGLSAYLGTNDCREIEKRMGAGDDHATLHYQGMIYQICKRIGAKSAVLKGKVDYIVLTGGLAKSTYLVEQISERVSFIAPLKAYPSVEEMSALAQGAYRVVSGLEEAKTYNN